MRDEPPLVTLLIVMVEAERTGRLGLLRAGMGIDAGGEKRATKLCVAAVEAWLTTGSGALAAGSHAFAAEAGGELLGGAGSSTWQSRG